MENWEGVRVVVLGLARQGKALTRYLTEHGAEVIASDLKREDELPLDELSDLEIQFELGDHPHRLLEQADLLCLSGGIPADLPLAQQARLQGIRVANDSQLFLENSLAPVIGITGSAGKTTTTELLGRMGRAAVEGSKRSVWVGGNIGRPLIADLDQIKQDDLVVMELSSFQLELMTASPKTAAVLNLTPNHLDRHHTLEAYTAAKANILNFQLEGDTAVLSREDPAAWGLRNYVQGRLLSFGVRPFDGEGTYVERGQVRLILGGEEVRLFPVEAISLRGPHNLQNVLAASALAGAAGIEPEAMLAGVEGFTGVEHRLEFVRTVGGADWYNDSIATAPERTVAAIRSFGEPVVLLAGGRDKDLDWGELITLISLRVDHLVLFGESGPMIEGLLHSSSGGRPYTQTMADGLEQAVRAAAEVADEGDVVLLAPGGTSYDEFIDFAARGARFKELVRGL
ncbi:MAG: UDP-N-acetylmuramoyl-L-alanine--D-glutamate ligase [Chloroflexi bacterium]|nr:UDP-N-acetylmuramoyl-L-alanine--D-glutamate ligase [Chloroflexota bacterium]